MSKNLNYTEIGLKTDYWEITESPWLGLMSLSQTTHNQKLWLLRILKCFYNISTKAVIHVGALTKYFKVLKLSIIK